MAEKKAKINDRGYIAVGPEVHKRAKKAAVNLEVSLREYTIEALERRLGPDGKSYELLAQILASTNQQAKGVAVKALENATHFLRDAPKETK